MLFALALKSIAQNIGIGTITPLGKLQVNHRSDGIVPTILLYDSVANAGGSIEFRNAGARKWMQQSSLSTNASSQYFDFRTDSLYVMTLRGSGNVGIGNLSPTNRLDVAGDINLTGVLKLDGSSGISGKILQSNGASSQTWVSPTNSLYSNNYADYLATGFTVVTGGPTSNVLSRTIVLTGTAKVKIRSAANLNGLSMKGNMQTAIDPATAAVMYSTVYFQGNVDGYANPTDEIVQTLAAGTYTIYLTFAAHSGSSSYSVFSNGTDFIGNITLGTRLFIEIIYQ